MVHSIDTALDIDNYGEFTIPALQNSIEGVFKVNNKKENDITYRFTNQPPANIGRQNTANIIPGPQGVKAKARNTESPRSAFELFFTLDMVQNNIVIYTNYKINQTIDTNVCCIDVNREEKCPHVVNSNTYLGKNQG